VLIGTVAFETIRWGVLAFVLSRLAVRLQDAGVTSGFALRQNLKRAPSLLGIGIAVGVVVTVTLYGLSLIEYRVGYLNVLPWPVANGEALDVRLVAGGGVRNLVGEEVFARLGAQSIALSLLQRMRARAALAVILSSLYFEIWHNPFEVPQFLNFAASCVLAWAYHKFGYEVAAVAHCVADWLALGFLPAILFR
jgi:hypothetical protein